MPIPRRHFFKRFVMLWACLSTLLFIAAGLPSYTEAAPPRAGIAKKKHTTKQPYKKAKAKKSRYSKPVVKAKAVYCLNLAGNQTILSRNPDSQLPVASLTKLMTALVTLDKMSLKDEVSVPEHVKTIPKSVVGLKPDDRLSVKDLLHGLLMASGNDCAETLACAYPGGKEKFIEAMNQKARSLGTRRTVFHSPSGLDNKKDTEEKGGKSPQVASNLSTAREIASVARHAFMNDTIRAISLKRSYVMSGKDGNEYSVRNTNKLLRDGLPISGGKTGFTCSAGHCLVTQFTPGRNEFLIVVLGSPDHFQDTRLVYRKALEQTKALGARRHPTRTSGYGNKGSKGWGG